MELIRYSNGQGEGLRLDREEAEALEKALKQALRGYSGKAEVVVASTNWEIGIEILED